MRKLMLLVSTLLPVSAFASASLGEVADNLMAPTEIVTKLVLAACVIVGIALILVALAQYRIHRQSPKLVPLSTPIILLILGVIALLIPYGTRLLNPINIDADRSKVPSTIPMPDTGKRGADLPMPSDRPQSKASDYNPPSSSAPDTTDPGTSGSGHWTQNPGNP